MNYDKWIGTSKDQSDSMAPEQLRRFEAMMDRNPSEVQAGTVLPPCAHWVYFTPMERQSDIAADGHAKKGSFLPPVDLPKRMWAGGKILFKKPLKTGIPADKKSTIVKIEEKEGSSGKLCFVTVRHQISASGSVAIDEEQQIVYRESSDEGAHPIRTKPMDIDFDWKKSRVLTSTELFRYSALTFNGHKIHYDFPYATDEEGYPNLVVHGPLLLTLLLNAFKSKSDGKVIEEVEYKSVGPIYLGEELTITSKDVDNTKVELRVLGPDNKIAMMASVKWIYSWNQ
ncbi:MAG: MaoC family dehydratase N-terminal domain-containing protein [Balneolaceae bacterium]|nr:MaoC family dehydratase N-terminal domain-containing protein [Balneolaceae bacterium]